MLPILDFDCFLQSLDSPAAKCFCDQLVQIPMLGSVSSLNVSVAAGILMFEAVRQRAV